MNSTIAQPSADNVRETDLQNLSEPLATGAIGRGIVSRRLMGWVSPAIDLPEGQRIVEIFIDDIQVGAAALCVSRPDLETTFGYVPETGFEYIVPLSFCDGAGHKVAVRLRETGAYLKYSGQVLNFPRPETAEVEVRNNFQGSVNEINSSSITGWAWDAENPRQLSTIELWRGSDLLATAVASLYREDLHENGIGDGQHAFRIDVPDSLADGEIHPLTVRFGSGGPVVKRGRFELGPIIIWPDQVYARTTDVLQPTRLVNCSQMDALPRLKVRVGVATHVAFKIGNIDFDSERILFRVEVIEAGIERLGRLSTHIYPAGLNGPTKNYLKYEGDKDVWSVAFRIVPDADAVLTVPGYAFFGDLVEVSLLLTVQPINGQPANADKLLALHVPIMVAEVAPVTFNILDSEPNSRRTNHLDMTLLGDAAHIQPHRLAASFPDYIPPVIYGHVDEALERDLHCVARYRPFQVGWTRATLLEGRPDLFLVQADMLLRQRTYTSEDAAGLIAVIEACRLTRTPVVYLQDVEDVAERQRVDWMKDYADIVVNLLEDDPQNGSQNGSKSVSEKPFISPGSINPYLLPRSLAPRAALLSGDRPPNYLIDGFWDCIEAQNSDIRDDLLALRPHLHLIDSRFAFSRFRAIDAADLYWNVLGCVASTRRAEVVARYDQLVLLPSSSRDLITRYRSVLEALALRCALTVLGPQSRNHAYAAVLARIFGDQPPPSGSRTVFDFERSARARLTPLLQHNTVDVIHRLLDRSNPALVAHNIQAMRPKISCVLVSKRPHLVEAALAGILRQSYDNLEIIVILHGEPRDEALYAAWAAHPAVVRIDYVPQQRTLGFCLNYAVDCSTGDYIAKFDDDDLYGVNHIRDFVLSLEYRTIQLFARPLGFVYLAKSGTLVSQSNAIDYAFRTYDSTNYEGFVGAGGTLILSRDLARRIRFSEMRRGGLDSDLVTRALEAGESLVLGDPHGFALCRNGAAGTHTWLVDDQSFLRKGIVLGTDMAPEEVARLVDGDAAAWDRLGRRVE